jgi:hypothetical protein
MPLSARAVVPNSEQLISLVLKPAPHAHNELIRHRGIHVSRANESSFGPREQRQQRYIFCYGQNRFEHSSLGTGNWTSIVPPSSTPITEASDGTVTLTTISPI